MVNENFCSDKKIGAIFYHFLVQNLAIFATKIRFLDIFFETAHRICLKLGQNLGTIALDHRMAVLCLRKFLLRPFWPFWGQKYIACGDIYNGFALFGSFSSKAFMFLVIFCYLNYVYSLGMRNEKL